MTTNTLYFGYECIGPYVHIYIDLFYVYWDSIDVGDTCLTNL